MEAEKKQQLKLVGACVLLASAVGVYLYFGREKPALSSDINFVCVETGKSFKIDRDKIKVVPMPNPDTGRATLLPCITKNGSLFIDPHYRGSLNSIQGEKSHVDATTLQVK